MTGVREHYFTVWAQVRQSDSKPVKQLGQWLEPIEAVEAAESLLSASGRPNESFAEVRFNGDREPHIIVGWLGEGRVAIYNTDACRWPVFNIPGTQSFRDMLIELPDWMKGEKGEEFQEEDNGRAEEDQAQARSGTGDQKTREDRTTIADFNKHEDSEEEDSDEDEEPPMRLKLFSKIRSPKGWRKRAESNMESDVNVFHFRAGYLDERNPERPREIPFLFATLREEDANRETAEFKIVLPPGVELERIAGRTWSARIPFRALDRI